MKFDRIFFSSETFPNPLVYLRIKIFKEPGPASKRIFLPFSLPFPKIESKLGKNEAQQEVVTLVRKTALENI